MEFEIGSTTSMEFFVSGYGARWICGYLCFYLAALQRFLDSVK